MGKRLSNEIIVTALLEKGSIRAAAAKLGLKERTIYDRMKTEDFKALFKQAKTDYLKSATAKLQSNIGKAADTLVNVMEAEETPPSTKVYCANSILQQALKFTENVDIIDRLEALENGVANND